MKILISGGTGFIGRQLCDQLLKTHSVVIRSRQSDMSMSGVKFIKTLDELDVNEYFDVAINLAGEPIADKRWSKQQKQRILESRLNITEEFIAFFKRVKHKPKLFISGSAIGVYGVASSDQPVDESGLGDESFSSILCQSWEEKAKSAELLNIRTCILRTGIVISKQGGALKKMLLPFKLGLGGKIGEGSQWMSWVHIEDMVGIILTCISNEALQGVINCTAPSPVTNSEFTKILGAELKRPVICSAPAFVIKLLLGQMGDELLLNGKKIVPKKLEEIGYVFRYTQLADALKGEFL